MDINAAFKPFIDIFTRSQVQSILLAWLPTKLAPYLTGIMAVDMFISTVIASGTTAIAYIIYQLICYLITKNSNYKKSITIQIEYYALGQYNERKKNIIYESLSWLISQQLKKLGTGSFVLKVVTNMNNKDVKILPKSNILPEINHEISSLGEQENSFKKKIIIGFKPVIEGSNEHCCMLIAEDVFGKLHEPLPSNWLFY
jgi:hypothetical protein